MVTIKLLFKIIFLLAQRLNNFDKNMNNYAMSTKLKCHSFILHS